MSSHKSERPQSATLMEPTAATRGAAPLARGERLDQLAITAILTLLFILGVYYLGAVPLVDPLGAEQTGPALRESALRLLGTP